MGKDKENSFESNLQKLESIVDKLESGEIGLEESVKLYEEGMKIKKICDKKLQDIEMQIKKIKIEDNKLVYLNRLSDLMFVIGRCLNRDAGIEENFWNQS